jgi:hypothetical protein
VIGACPVAVDFDTDTGNGGVLACWRQAGHPGDHYDQADRLYWRTDDADGPPADLSQIAKMTEAAR